MKDDKSFNTLDPMFSSINTEGIGAPLTDGTNFELSGSNVNSNSLAILNDKIYAFGGLNFSSNPRVFYLRAYSLTGTRESTNDLTIASDSFYTFASYNNELYVMQIPTGGGSNIQLRKYSSSGTLISTVLTNINVNDTVLLAVDSSNYYIRSSGDHSILVKNLSAGTTVRTILESSLLNSGESTAQFTTQGLVSTPDKFYFAGPVSYPNEKKVIRVLDRSYNRVTDDDTDVTSDLGTNVIRFLAHSGSTLYLNTHTNRAYTYNLPATTYSATWATGTPTVRSDRSVRIVLTLSENPGTTFATSDFEVQNSSGTVQSTGWTITEIGTGTTTRTIQAAPASTVVAGTYKIVLKEGGFGSDKPASAISSPDFTIGNYVAEVATISWSNERFFNGKIEATLNVSGANITGLADSDFDILNDSDVVQSGWTFDTIQSSVNDGNNTIIRATPPANTNASFKIRLNQTKVRSGGSASDNAPASNVDSSSVSVNNVPLVASASWMNETYTSGNLQATLTFTGANITGIASSDFDILNDSNAVQAGWTITAPSTATSGTGIIVSATPPANTNASFKIRLKATSVQSGGSSTDNAPAANVDSSSVAVNNVPISVSVTASWSNENYASGMLEAALTFTGANITGISSTAFEIRDSVNNIVSGWAITAPISATDGVAITIRATPPANTNASFKIAIKRLSVRSAGSSSDDSPIADTLSDLVAVNNSFIPPVDPRADDIYWSNIGTDVSRKRIIGTLNFPSDPGVVTITSSSGGPVGDVDIQEFKNGRWQPVRNPLATNRFSIRGTGTTREVNWIDFYNSLNRLDPSRLFCFIIYKDSINAGLPPRNIASSEFRTSAYPQETQALWSNIQFINGKLEGVLFVE